MTEKELELIRQAQREYMREYRKRPEVKEKERAYQKEYRQRPEVKERKEQQRRQYWLKKAKGMGLDQEDRKVN